MNAQTNTAQLDIDLLKERVKRRVDSTIRRRRTLRRAAWGGFATFGMIGGLFFVPAARGSAAMREIKAALAALAAATVALAGCSVDQPGQEADKPTIRVGYQTFPSGDLIVKNNRWLEEALPESPLVGKPVRL